LTAGTRRNGTSKFGLFKRNSRDGEQTVQLSRAGGPADHYTGRHADSRSKTARKAARKRASRVVPATGVAAALAVGAAAFGLVAASGHPQGGSLSADLSLPGNLNSATHSGVGVGVDSAASSMIRATRTASAAAAPASARPQASRPPKAAAKPKAAPSSAAATPRASSAARSPSTEAAATVAPSATASASATPTAATPKAATLSCNSDGLLPDNVTAIVGFLIANGYSDNAAAGIAGNMYQESKGNPESEGMGGGGLIGFTPLPYGYVTGDPAADLETQLKAVLTYNQQWSSYLPELNGAASPADAAYIYVTDFERAGIPAASTREASAEDIAAACGI
jgi:Phage tail lysozyme